jgi:hypothetical protein
VTGCVGDDDFASVSGKEAIGDVNGNSLLALGREAVDISFPKS